MTVQFSAAGPPAATTAPWRLQLLGAFQLHDEDHHAVPLRSHAAMALLARVAMAPGRDHAREELASLLWPEADAAVARNRLRQTLSTIKSVLEPPGSEPVLIADRRALRAVPGMLWCDVPAFEAAVRTGRGHAAQALYAGELLPGFYADWIVEERHRLQALHDRIGPLPPEAPLLDPQAAPAAAAAAISQAPAAGPKNRLPQYLTRLIGADEQGARLRAWVAEHRLVSVLGAGGSGKTRLAVEVARLLCEAGPAQLPQRFERAVFVSLVGVSTATGLLDRLQSALRVEAAGDAVELLLGALDQRRILLLLDNAEQLDADATRTIAFLAERLPQAHWLVTTRRPLELDGEHHFTLDSLLLPPEGADLATVALSPAVLLFVDRARARQPDFHVKPATHAALAALVRWLDGLPLAIELAATHARVVAPAELLALLRASRANRHSGSGGSLALLSRRGTRSGSDSRHASMLDVVAWTWKLLDPAQQAMLLALCQLPAGATLAAACAICSGGALATDAAPVAPVMHAAQEPQPLPAAQALALLEALVSQSVLRLSKGQDGQSRYTLFEPVREYVLSVHDAATLRAQRGRVLGWMLQWARDMPATPPLPAVRDDLPNIAQAMDEAPADGNANDAVLLVLMLQSSWGEIALPNGLLDTLNRLLDSPGLDDSRAAAGHALAASACQEAGRLQDVQRHRALALARPCTDAALRLSVLSRLARLHWRVDRNAVLARELIAEALPLARSLARPNAEASLLSLTGHLLLVVDRDAAAGQVYTQQSLALWQQSGNRHLINAGRYNLAVSTIRAGQPAAVLDELAALAAEGLALQDWDLASGALEARGTALLALRRWPEARADLHQSLAIGWDGMEMVASLYALWNIAPVLARQRQGRLAAETMGAAEAQWRQRYGEPDPSDLRDLKRVRRFVRVLLGAEGAQAAWKAGAARSLGDTVQAVLLAPEHV